MKNRKIRKIRETGKSENGGIRKINFKSFDGRGMVPALPRFACCACLAVLCLLCAPLCLLYLPCPAVNVYVIRRLFEMALPVEGFSAKSLQVAAFAC